MEHPDYANHLDEDMGIPIMSPEEQLQSEAIEEASEEEYDFTISAEKLAKQRGQIVVTPRKNELQIDIDSGEQWALFRERFEELGWCHEWTYVHPSRSGPNRFHVYIEHPDKIFTTSQRLLYQQFLGDDPVRVKLNFLRYNEGVLEPSRLFEAPDFEMTSGQQAQNIKITPVRA